jgi:hypothetical protein
VYKLPSGPVFPAMFRHWGHWWPVVLGTVSVSRHRWASISGIEAGELAS